MTKSELEADKWFASRSTEEQAALRAGSLSWPDRKMQRWGVFYREEGPFDWTGCSCVEVMPGRVSGVPTLVRSRMPADLVLDFYEQGMEPEEIAEEYEQDLESVRGALQFAGAIAKEHIPA